jgi:hypothetical protein
VTVSAGQQVMIEFKGSYFEREVILWAVRWYVVYPIGCRQLEEFMEEHGVEVDHTTLSRWVLKYVLVAEHDAADQEHFRQITQGKLVAQAALLHGSTRRSQRTQPHLSSFDPHRDRASELQHAVQHMHGDANFGGTTPVLAEA